MESVQPNVVIYSCGGKITYTLQNESSLIISLFLISLAKQPVDITITSSLKILFGVRVVAIEYSTKSELKEVRLKLIKKTTYL